MTRCRCRMAASLRRRWAAPASRSTSTFPMRTRSTSRRSRPAPARRCRSRTSSGVIAMASSPIRSATSGRSRPGRKTSPPRRWSSVAASSWPRCRARIASDPDERRRLAGLRRVRSLHDGSSAVLKLIVAALALCALAPTARSATMDTLTVVTLNVWHDQHDWPKRLQVILAEMRRIRPDILCLQEVLQNPDLRNQAETLADSLGYHLQFASVDGPDRPKRYGNAVLTPHRILVSGERNLSPADDYRAVAHVRIDWRGH